MMAAFDEALFEASLHVTSDEWTKDTLSSLPTCKGVLLFTGPTGRPIQLLQAANLRRTAQAKLLREPEPSGPRKADISQVTAGLFYTRCYHLFEMQLQYIRLAHEVFQAAAADWFQLPKLSLAVIETDADLPFFAVSDHPQAREHRRVFGLFPNRKAAAAFCDILNTVFRLCRNPSLLGTGRESSCPYLQMQTCPGPCLAPALRADYAHAVQRACRTAAGDRQPVLDHLQEQMHHAARSMQFEAAAKFKKDIQLLKRLTGRDYDWVHDLSSLQVLHIDQGPKRKISGKNKKQQLYTAWKITAETVEALGTFVPKTPGQVASFIRRTWNAGHRIDYTTDPKEHLSVLCFFLFRSNRPGLWLDCSGHIPDALYDSLNDIFSRP